MDFSQLTTLEDWTKALDQLIAASTTAVQNSDTAKIADLQDDLFNYQQISPVNFDSLDNIAAKLSLKLNGINRQATLRNIAEIAQELNNLKNILGVATEHANQSADAIQLKTTKDFLSKAKTSLIILKGLRTELDNNNTDLGRKVAAVFKAIKDFEEAFPDA
jgi:hypothetical protein